MSYELLIDEESWGLQKKKHKKKKDEILSANTGSAVRTNKRTNGKKDVYTKRKQRTKHRRRRYDIKIPRMAVNLPSGYLFVCSVGEKPPRKSNQILAFVTTKIYKNNDATVENQSIHFWLN